MNTYKASLCLHNWVSWKASLWLNPIPLSRAVNQRLPQPPAYCVFSSDVSPCCAYSRNISHTPRLPKTCNYQIDSKHFAMTMPLQSYSMAESRVKSASWIQTNFEYFYNYDLLTLVNSRETLVGAFPSLRLDLDAPRLSEILWLPPLGAAPHSAPCGGDLDSVPL